MVKIIVGTMGRSPFAVTDTLSTPEQFETFLDVCERHGVKELDTARLYGQGENERLLGEVSASQRFEVSTKIMNGGEGSLKSENVLTSGQKSLEVLKTGQVDIFYIHRPDRGTPLEETCAAIDKLHKEGAFKRFGICSYTAEEVAEMYALCIGKGYVTPSVYQGNFNPLSRKAEFELFPTLRKLGMQFYAYGPLASGLLAKALEDSLQHDKNSRFCVLPIAGQRYLQDEVVSEVRKIQELCQAENVSILDATYRWFMHHSALNDQDGVLLGSSTSEQLEKNLEATQGGPLSDTLAKGFEELWKNVEKNAAPYAG